VGVTRVLVVGDTLLDRDLEGEVERLCPEAPVPVVENLVQHSRPGGAGLAAVLAARDGVDVTLVTALSRDEGGRELRTLLCEEGVDVVDLGLDGPTPEKVRVRSQGRLLIRLDHGGRKPGRVGSPPLLSRGDGILIADYGRGLADALRPQLERAARSVPLVWDPHPKGNAPVAAASLATPNRAEATGLATQCCNLEQATVELRDRWGVRAVAVTAGEEGAVLAEQGAAPVVVPCTPAPGGDPCGAGDRFASAAAVSLAQGSSIAAAVTVAVDRAAAFVAAGGAGALAADLATQSSKGSPAGTTVATGGCFDLLHAGHVRMLESARLLGDRLVVLLNSDESVRRLKGPDRPLVPEEDREAVLRALGCVDDVVVFEEPTPEHALARLRPDVWVKGGDYDPSELPEAELVRRYGGRVEILPYIEGRSTSRLIGEAALRGR
jgi:D-beta-D-heptose 7-phosphate kinase / D-beta-D-heptose 1-phosphate adenosyltransferase